MTEQKTPLKFKKPRLIHFLIALVLAVLIVDRGAAYFYEPKPGSKEIILYTTDWCGYCEALRAYLKGYSIPYIERDVEKSLSGALGRWGLGHGWGVPLSVIGERVVYGYDLPKINEALQALGYSIQGTEKQQSAGDTGGMRNYRPSTPTATDCVPAENFDTFYAKFKVDDGFRIQRTRFPLRKQILAGAPPRRTTEEVVEIEKNQVETGQELVYLDYEIIETSGYKAQITGKEGSTVEVTTTMEDSLDPLTIHKFHKVSGCWFLVELMSYEYFGSMMILGSLDSGSPQG